MTLHALTRRTSSACAGVKSRLAASSLGAVERCLMPAAEGWVSAADAEVEAEEDDEGAFARA